MTNYEQILDEQVFDSPKNMSPQLPTPKNQTFPNEHQQVRGSRQVCYSYARYAHCVRDYALSPRAVRFDDCQDSQGNRVFKEHFLDSQSDHGTACPYPGKDDESDDHIPEAGNFDDGQDISSHQGNCDQVSDDQSSYQTTFQASSEPENDFSDVGQPASRYDDDLSFSRRGRIG
ncbi:hypothetical protein CSAL01_08614 [Colletotrichum salicis]|uniref:Uncharacterized protein n=1 Tax=Colletotrichum salicis TaxID=1209931 RepID=A0A135V3F8_9PEZI|nr:hypothetical protein CSAL01_08614 [Colletotrichum salicis]